MSFNRRKDKNKIKKSDITPGRDFHQGDNNYYFGGLILLLAVFGGLVYFTFFQGHQACGDEFFTYTEIKNLNNKKEGFLNLLVERDDPSSIIPLTFIAPSCWNIKAGFNVSAGIKVKEVKETIIRHFDLGKHLKKENLLVSPEWKLYENYTLLDNEELTLSEAGIYNNDQIFLKIYPKEEVNLNPVDTMCFDNTGKMPDGSYTFTFPISGNNTPYTPSGRFGDLGDIKVTFKNKGNIIVIQYVPRGEGPQEWDWKYEDGVSNPYPAEFVGLTFLEPPNARGDRPTDGYNLRDFSDLLSLKARGYSNSADSVYVEMVLPVIDWKWKNKRQSSTAYPGTLRRKRLGIEAVGRGWRTLEYKLSDMNKNQFCRVIGALTCNIRAADNEVHFDSKSKMASGRDTFWVELKDIVYQKKPALQ